MEFPISVMSFDFSKTRNFLKPVEVNTREEFFHSQYDFEFDFSGCKRTGEYKTCIRNRRSRWS